MAAVIREAQSRAESEVTFNSEIPLIDFGIFVMDITCLLEKLRSELRQLRRKRIWELQCRFAIDDGLVIERLVCAMDRVCRAQQSAERPLYETSQAATDHRLSISCGSPCEPDAWRKISFLGVAKAFRNARLLRGEDRCVSNRRREIRIQD